MESPIFLNMTKIIVGIIFLLLNTYWLKAQITGQTYPRTVNYISVVHPIATVYENETVYNFTNDYTVGFPIGINILKSDRFGFSFEITPFIKSENGVSKMNNVLFHPGIMFRRKNGFTINTRMAFETAGRYGFTAVFSKVIAKTPTYNYFIALPVPFRFGNERPTSIGAGLQVGITF